MNEHDIDVIKAHDDLKKEIMAVLYKFSDKYFSSEENYSQSAFILQSVLSEVVSSVEYRLGKIAPFTTHQTDNICYQIGEWYLMMKPLLEGQHNLGFMKEKLKTMICGD